MKLSEIFSEAAGDGVYIIAEIGQNHNGDPQLAKDMIAAAAEAGCDAVKFQSFKVDRFALRSTLSAEYIDRATGKQQTYYEFLKSIELSTRDLGRLFAYATELGVESSTSVFDEETLQEVALLGVPFLKIASCDLTHKPLMRGIAATGIPVILSSGMGDLEEIERAIDLLRRNGNRRLIVLHCVSEYPVSPQHCNLRSMRTIAERLGVTVGYSDHNDGYAVAVAAAALGARVIEKHFTLDRNLPGPDQALSLEPETMKTLVEAVRDVSSALGSAVKEPTAAERQNRKLFRRSIVARRDIRKGSVICLDDLDFKRPGTGLSPWIVDDIVGKVAKTNVAADQIIEPDFLEER